MGQSIMKGHETPFTRSQLRNEVHPRALLATKQANSLQPPFDFA